MYDEFENEFVSPDSVPSSPYQTKVAGYHIEEYKVKEEEIQKIMQNEEITISTSTANRPPVQASHMCTVQDTCPRPK